MQWIPPPPLASLVTSICTTCAVRKSGLHHGAGAGVTGDAEARHDDTAIGDIEIHVGTAEHAVRRL